MFTNTELKMLDAFLTVSRSYLIYKPEDVYMIDGPDSTPDRMTKTELIETMQCDLKTWGYFFRPGNGNKVLQHKPLMSVYHKVVTV